MTLGLVLEIGRRVQLLAALNDIDTPFDYGWRVVEDEVFLFGNASIVAWEAANRNDPVWKLVTGRTDKSLSHSRGGGGPSAQSQPPPSSSEFSPQARASAQGGKAGVPARASQRGSRPGRKSCPKGHYWSYKEKKCLKSKYR